MQEVEHTPTAINQYEVANIIMYPEALVPVERKIH
jgi:hypothetical protein